MTRPLHEELLRLVSASQKILVMTGAGVSTDSGLADFRSAGGLWDGLDPLEISHPSKIGTPEFYEFFRRRIEDVAAHEPNDIHRLVSLGTLSTRVLAIATQNIDGYHLFQDGPQVLEVHGSLEDLFCESCGVYYDKELYTEGGTYICPDCQGYVRPEVTLFGENLNPLVFHRLDLLTSECDMILVLGTSLQVQPFASFVQAASASGKPVAIVTIGETPYDELVDLKIDGPILPALEHLERHLGKKVPS